ncbi:hypothetical protein GCM10027422_27570 [Hymenobacter arcticus]
MALEMQLPGPTREAMWPVLPRLLRVRPGDSQHLRQLAAHPQAAEEVPRLLHDIFTHPDPDYYWGYPLAAWLAEAPMEALLGPALPHLRYYLGRLTQPQLAELLKQLHIRELPDETRSPSETLDSYAASPNRLGLLALLAELATAAALAALTQAALARAQARRLALTATGPTRPAN